MKNHEKRNSDSYDQDAEGNMNMRHGRRLISGKSSILPFKIHQLYLIRTAD